ncbi:serine hydrolase [Longimicrobium sp.]|uniref:serine hydrolase n=1 Tax=Longimicrobium sp. TaxID=2029185 RepID=UPI002E30EF66|nr:serine hydrolase [Longimicrobium sp.]HEX6041161.1 serine hydrolase [Longimicrobium sp.]
MRRLLAVLALLATALVPASAAAQADVGALRRTLEEIIRPYEGTVGVSIQNLATGQTLSIRGDEKFPSASLIKVSVLVALLDEVRRGAIRLDDLITMIARDQVGGSGVLQHFHSGLGITVEDAARLMIIISDNTATNLVLDKVPMRTVWAKMDSLGLPATRIHSKTFLRNTSVAMDSSVRYGLGVTTPDETVRLFALLHQGRAVSPRMDSLALSILRQNEDWNKLVRWLPDGATAAHKTGDVDQSRNDCGILYGPDAPVAVCVMTRENRDTSYATDNPVNLLMARIGVEVYRFFNPSAPAAVIPSFQGIGNRE